MFVNKIFAFLSKSFGLYAPTVRPSLVVIRGLVGSGGGICNCVVQPSEVSNDCNSFGNNSSLELLCCVISHLVLLAWLSGVQMASVNYITKLTKKKTVIYFELISFLYNLGIFLSIWIFIYFQLVGLRVLFVRTAVYTEATCRSQSGGMSVCYSRKWIVIFDDENLAYGSQFYSTVSCTWWPVIQRGIFHPFSGFEGTPGLHLGQWKRISPKRWYLLSRV